MTYTLAIMFAVAFALFLIYQVYRVVIGYQKATGTGWQRFLAAFSYSHTILLSRVASFSAAATIFVVNFLPALDPTSTVGALIVGLLDPKYSTYYALAFAVLIEVVRKMPSNTSPITPPPQAVVIPPAPVLIPLDSIVGTHV